MASLSLSIYPTTTYIFSEAETIRLRAARLSSTNWVLNMRSSGGYPVIDNSGKAISSTSKSFADLIRRRIRSMFPYGGQPFVLLCDPIIFGPPAG